MEFLRQAGLKTMPLAKLVFEGQFMGLFWVLVMCACRACFFITVPTSSWPTSVHTVVLGIQEYCELASKRTSNWTKLPLDKLSYAWSSFFLFLVNLSVPHQALGLSCALASPLPKGTWNCSLALIKPGLLAVCSSERQPLPRKLVSFNCETKDCSLS